MKYQVLMLLAVTLSFKAMENEPCMYYHTVENYIMAWHKVYESMGIVTTTTVTKYLATGDFRIEARHLTMENGVQNIRADPVVVAFLKEKMALFEEAMCAED